jgi:hypothetical protein
VCVDKAEKECLPNRGVTLERLVCDRRGTCICTKLRGEGEVVLDQICSRGPRRWERTQCFARGFHADTRQ